MRVLCKNLIGRISPPLIFLIILSSFSFAIVDKITFITPEIVQGNQDLNFTFDVHSNVTQLTDTSTSCSFYAVNKLGRLVDSGNAVYDAPNNIWNCPLFSNVLTSPTTISLYVSCNDTSNIKSVQKEFIISSDGHEQLNPEEKDHSIFYWGALLIGGLFILGFTFKDSATVTLGSLCLAVYGGFVVAYGFLQIQNNIVTTVGMIIGVVGAYLFLRITGEEAIEILNSFKTNN